MRATTVTDSFTEWAADAQPKIRRALVAAFGVDRGVEATAAAMAIAWER